MPIYEINGKRIETAQPLSEDEIDEIAQSISAKPDKEKSAPVEPQEKSLFDTYLDWQKQGAKGVISGAADIGNTLINASTFIPRKIASAAGSDVLENWNQDREDSLRDYQKANESPMFNAGGIVGEIAGTAGVGNVLKIPAIAANIPRVAQALETGGFAGLGGGKVLENALIRLGAGATVGGASAGMIDPESADTGAVMGAAATAVGVPLLKGAAYGAGKAYDVLSGRAPQVVAGKIARDVAGSDLAAIRAANELAPDTLTSSQAAAGVPRFEWSALGERARQGDPTAFGLKADAQEAARLAKLDAVTPDLNAAVARRTAVTAPLYDEAMNSTKQVNTRPVANLIDKYIADYPKRDDITTPMMQIRDDLRDPTGKALDTNVKSLMSLSENIKKKLEATKEGKPEFDVKALTKIKEKLDEQIGVAEPSYANARTKFKEMSAPVNQARLLQEMKNTLVNSKGGERVQPFLNAMGTAEKSLFRRADQSPRFGSLDEVLTAKQRAAKDSIVSELKRDAELSRRSQESTKKVSDVVSGDKVRARLPSLINAWFSAANRGMDVAETGINQRSMAIISEGMKTGKSANEMMNVLPTSERNKILKSIIEMEKGGVLSTAVGVSSAGE